MQEYFNSPILKHSIEPAVFSHRALRLAEVIACAVRRPLAGNKAILQQIRTYSIYRQPQLLGRNAN